jgi:hypothetical protein
MTTRFVQEPRNRVGINGALTLVQINPQRAADLGAGSAYFGWLFYPGPEVDQWVTLRKLSGDEIEEAQDMAADMMVLDAGR